MSEQTWCRCGNVKSPKAMLCRACFDEEIKVHQVPTETKIDPVRDAFEWVIAQSQGKVS